MSGTGGWDSYRTVHGAELRAAAREFTAHGWPVVEESATALRLVTGSVLDVLEVPAAIGRGICARLRAVDVVVPVAGTPTGPWWYPMSPGAVLPAELAATEGVLLHTGGAGLLAPPSQVPDGWVHWRVAPASTGFRVPPHELIVPAAADSARRAPSDSALLRGGQAAPSPRWATGQIRQRYLPGHPPCDDTTWPPLATGGVAQDPPGQRAESGRHPGAQRPAAAVPVGMRF